MKKTIVIKIGGNKLKEERKYILKSIVSIYDSYNIIIVHGGKAQITSSSDRKPLFIKGQRYTDEETLSSVIKALSEINIELVREINTIKNGVAVGICGTDGMMINVKRNKKLGYVGIPIDINVKLLSLLIKYGFIPVISPLCSDRKTLLNVNADSVAAIVSTGLKVDILVYISDIPGVLDNKGKVIKEINKNIAKELKNRSIITEGMIPKINSCLCAVDKGVKNIYITDRFTVKKGNFIPSGTRIY